MAFQYRMLALSVLVMGLTACATPYSNTQVEQIVFEEPDAPLVPKGMTNEEIFSNPNVIVYPVTGDLSQSNRAFAKYRGVVENTTAGGFTVFDPSVTVYAIEGQGMKPAYLPEYSVPRYAQNYMINDTAAPASMQPLPLTHQADPYVPDTLYMQPRSPMAPSVPLGIENNYGELPERNVEQRRSRPVLTGYD